AVRISSSSARGSTLPPPITSALAIRHLLYVQICNGPRVVLDEGSARLDLVAHQHREDAVGGEGVIERDLRERARGGRHRGFAELLGVHLAESLEALQFDSPLCDRHHGWVQILEGGGCLSRVAESHLEGGSAGELDQLCVYTGQSGLLFDRPYAQLERVRLEQLGGVGVTVDAAALQPRDRSLGAQRLLIQQRGLLAELDDIVPVGGAHRGGPALVLLEQPGETLPARLGQLELLAVAVEDLDLLPLVGEQDLLE